MLKIGDVIYVEPVGKPGDYGLRQVPEVNGAIVAMDPHTGRVLAMSGGFCYASSQFDRAIQALRQPGSSFKPFVYAAALDNGYTPVSKVLDAPFEMDQGPGRQDLAAEEFRDSTILGHDHAAARHRAVAQPDDDSSGAGDRAWTRSCNIPSASASTTICRRCWPIRIGSGETTLLQHGHRLFGVRQWRQEDHRLADRPHPGSQRHARSGGMTGAPATAATPPTGTASPSRCSPTRASRCSIRAPPIRSSRCCEGVVQRGTGRSVLAVGKPLAGKTGTSNDSKDVWFVGFSPDLACGVFVGFDNPRTLGALRAGRHRGRADLPRFHEGRAVGRSRRLPFRVAPGIEIVQRRLSQRRAVRAAPGSIPEAFKAEHRARAKPDAPVAG